jgi:hypothetical protein
MAMLVWVLILTNVLTGIALVSYIADAVHDKQTAEIEKQNIIKCASVLDAEWRRLDAELAMHRKLTKELTAIGGN